MSNKHKATKYSAPERMKIWVTPPGKQSWPADVIAKSDENLQWVLKEASVEVVASEDCSTIL